MFRSRLTSLLLLALVLGGAAAPASAAEPDLPSVASGHRPGPDALYAKPPSSVPQLENAAPWAARPILVSGAQAYRDGEWLYQDFILDDHGAAGVPDPEDPSGFRDFLYSPTAGSFTYPRDPVYANNAADIVELRMKPVEGATALRITLNTLEDPDRTAVTVALGGDGAAREWPHGAGVSSPAEVFLTVRGGTAELRDAASGSPRTPAPTAAVDLERRQLDVRIPHAAWSPGTGKVRVTAGAGLWDLEASRYLAPRPGEATKTLPGGGAPGGPAIVNVVPRFDEPVPDVSSKKGGVTMADAAAGAKADGAWWREKAQADTLLTGDVTRFAAEVDFAKLAARTDDESGVPTTGHLNRIFGSRYVFGQGVDHSKVCFDVGARLAAGPKCIGRQVGQLQPYALYVPSKPQPAGGYGLTLLLHSLSANYNQYTGSRNQSQMGERGAGTLVATPAGRGPDGFYKGIAEADTFEVWTDVARHYALDPEWVSVTGYSMGGFGTFRYLARYPDLFARGHSVVGVPGTVEDQLASLRNTPIMTWAAVGDELVNIAETEEATRRMTDAGLRFVHDLFAPADHLTLATNDEYGPGADFLGEHRVDRNPHHITYVVDPTEDSAEADAVADHAYWVSGLRVRDDEALGTIDARSDAFGRGDEPVLDVEQSAGTLNGGSRGPLPYHRRRQDWGPAPKQPEADRLVLRVHNLSTATIDVRRARLSCAPALDLRADGPFDLRIDCPAPARTRRRATACRGTVRIPLPRVKGRRITRVTVTRGRRTLSRARGRDLRSVRVRRPTRRAFTVRVRATATGKGRTRKVTVTRRFRACGR